MKFVTIQKAAPQDAFASAGISGSHGKEGFMQTQNYITNDVNTNDTSVLNSLRKELRLTRVFCLISSILTVCLLISVIFLVNRLQPVYQFMEDTQPVLARIAELDTAAVNTLEQLNVAVGDVDWEQLSGSLGKLDVDAINEALENLDTEELTITLKNLNDAVDTLKNIGDKLSSLPAVFGIK